MTTMATMYGEWRRQDGKHRMHLYRNGKPVCGSRTPKNTTRVRRGTGELNDLCYECLTYGASGR